MPSDRKKYYFITINLLNDKHKNIIEWIKSGADESEQSLSSFCISKLKEIFNEENKDAEKSKVFDKSG